MERILTVVEKDKPPVAAGTAGTGTGTKRTSIALEYALSAVSAMGDSGLTTVPLKPSAAMLTAGARAGQVSVETAWKIYQAMIAEEP
jgi:hypothetical protein